MLTRARAESERFVVYFLRCPLTKLVRYIGITRSPDMRMQWHRADSRGTKGDWLQELRDQGLQPLFEIVTPPTTRRKALDCEALLTFLHERLYPGRLFTQLTVRTQRKTHTDLVLSTVHVSARERAKARRKKPTP